MHPLASTTASPVIGTPQGLAVYQNGVRVNEAFGDTVNWDLVPAVAVNRLNLVSNNPVLALAQRASRLATFCRAYGDVTPAQAMDSLIEQLPVFAEQIQRWADSGDPGFARLAGWNVPSRLRGEVTMLRTQRSVLAPG